VKNLLRFSVIALFCHLDPLFSNPDLSFSHSEAFLTIQTLFSAILTF
jgi:hypothetical protein